MLDSLMLMSKNKKNNEEKRLVVLPSKSRKIFLITFNVLSHKLYVRDLIWNMLGSQSCEK